MVAAECGCPIQPERTKDAEKPQKRKWPRLRAVALGTFFAAGLAVFVPSDQGQVIPPGSAFRMKFGLAEGIRSSVPAEVCASGNAGDSLARSGDRRGGNLRCIIGHLTQSNVRIVSGGVGAGIIIESGESRSLVLTAWHVPRGAASVKVQNGSGEFEAANIYYAPNGIDLSVIEIAGNIGPAVSFAEDAPWQGMDVVAVGSPLGGNDITTFGRIIGFVDVNSRGLSFQGLLTDAAINPGNSGGGVYSAETGELIGIVVSKPMLNPFQSAEGIGLVIPVSVLSQIPLDSWPRAQPPAGWRESDDH